MIVVPGLASWRVDYPHGSAPRVRERGGVSGLVPNGRARVRYAHAVGARVRYAHAVGARVRI